MQNQRDNARAISPGFRTLGWGTMISWTVIIPATLVNETLAVLAFVVAAVCYLFASLFVFCHAAYSRDIGSLSAFFILGWLNILLSSSYVIYSLVISGI